MRFCMVTTFYPPYNFGGDGNFVRGLSRALVRRGHEVEVVHCTQAYRLAAPAPAPGSEPDDENVVVHSLASRFGPLSPLVTQQTGQPGLKRGALRAILARDFDVVNFHNISLVGGPGVLAMSRAPVNVYTLHEHWLVCPTHILWKNRKQACDARSCFSCSLRSGIPPQLWRYSSLVKRSLEHVDVLLSPSEFTAGQHRAAGIEAPIQVMPTFPNFAPPAAEAFRPPDRPRFLFVGRVTATKGLERLLRDFEPLKEYDLHVIGDGDLKASLEQQYAHCDNIRFLGKVPQAELLTLYREATAIILSSLAPEVFPLTILEAFACGTPAIVRDVGGSREPIDATGAGFVYDSTESFLAAVHRLAGDPRLREQLGVQAREGYENLYTEAAYVDRYLNLIEDIRERKSAAAATRTG